MIAHEQHVEIVGMAFVVAQRTVERAAGAAVARLAQRRREYKRTVLRGSRQRGSGRVLRGLIQGRLNTTNK